MDDAKQKLVPFPSKDGFDRLQVTGCLETQVKLDLIYSHHLEVYRDLSYLNLLFRQHIASLCQLCVMALKAVYAILT